MFLYLSIRTRHKNRLIKVQLKSESLSRKTVPMFQTKYHSSLSTWPDSSVRGLSDRKHFWLRYGMCCLLITFFFKKSHCQMAKTFRSQEKATHVNLLRPLRARFFQACRHQLWYSAFSQMWENCWSQCISPSLMKAINNFTFPVHAKWWEGDNDNELQKHKNKDVYHCRFSGYKYHIRQGWPSKFHLGFSKIVWWLWSRNQVLTKMVYYSCFPNRRASHYGKSSFIPGREQAQIWHDSILCDFLQWLRH